jgi:hypothetical protein
MRALLVAALVSLAVPAAAGARPGRAVLTGCERADATATFEGRTSQVTRGERMAMRFVLQVRGPGERWHRVRVKGFSAWHTSDPGRSRYVYTKRVEGLVGPSAYRVVVRFRWLDADGGVIRRGRSVSRSCRMPDARPDLSVAAISVRRHPGRYAVTVRNAGRSPAGASRLELDLGDGGAPLTAQVGALAARESRTVVLAGRACVPGAVLTATADTGDAVDERDEGDDVLATTCP